MEFFCYQHKIRKKIHISNPLPLVFLEPWVKFRMKKKKDISNISDFFFFCPKTYSFQFLAEAIFFPLWFHIPLLISLSAHFDIYLVQLGFLLILFLLILSGQVSRYIYYKTHSELVVVVLLQILEDCLLCKQVCDSISVDNLRGEVGMNQRWGWRNYSPPMFLLSLVQYSTRSQR